MLDLPEDDDSTKGTTTNYHPYDHEGYYEYFENIRPDFPIFFNKEIGYWVVTRRQDVLAIFRDPDRFSAAISLQPVEGFPPELVEYLKNSGFAAEQTQASADRPKHTRIRAAAAQYLNMKRFNGLEPQVRALVKSHINAMKDQKTVDIVEALTYELPAKVIFLLLGIDNIEAQKIKQWGDNRLNMIFGQLHKDEAIEAGRQLVDFWLFSKAVVEERLNNPGDDYPSALLSIRNDDDSILTLNEISSLVFGLLLAGHETTTNATSNLILTLMKNKHQWNRLVADPSLIANAVEEGLRYASSVVSWRRQALEDVEIAGQTIQKGDKILLSLGSSNHDEAQFKHPEQFDVSRNNAKEHIAFGNGIHFCLGAPLARMEMRVIVEELSAAFPNMRLVEGQKIDWIRTIAFRGPVKLEVSLTD